jgi:peptide/nickel transport system substrate-binding protein
MLPPAFGRDAGIYPIGGADPATARRWLARARFKPSKLVLYTWNERLGIEFGQVFAFNLRQIGIDVEVQHFEHVAMRARARRPGEPYDIVMSGWAADYADGAGFFESLLGGRTLRQPGHSNFSRFDDARTNTRMQAAGRLRGAARRRAWAELDFDLMRTNPPWAPFIHNALRNFVSRSFGCYLSHPIYAVDLAAACKK